MKSTRKTLILCLCGFAAAIGLGIAAATLLDPPIEKLVRESQPELLAIVEAVRADPVKNRGLSYKGYQVPYSYPQEGQGEMVLFLKGVSGLGSETNYKGFYYTPVDEPLSPQGAGYTQIPEREGWRWVDDTDNWSYTERILSNWYSFTAHW